jgi:hypothetical protein
VRRSRALLVGPAGPQGFDPETRSLVSVGVCPRDYQERAIDYGVNAQRAVKELALRHD